jgi:beta-glucuronidase
MKHLPACLSYRALPISACILFTSAFVQIVLASASPAPSAPIVITGADRRAALSLDGDWASIVDPYFSGLFSFHHEEKANG